MDTVGNFLTTIRNASFAGKEVCVLSFSKMRESIAFILKANGYIADYFKITTEGNFPLLKICIKYVNDKPAIIKLIRFSKPGCRIYFGAKSIPPVISGLGLSILTTSKGVMSSRDATRMNVAVNCCVKSGRRICYE
ncbi:MAG: 30S ribosomal protein S8 [Puniceicoccales bacterium]|jgi:small subunit ribosomal protein S8|nr:30S ribosomal protein S8 [Puniceicoccales bacterium]